jgi:serine protease
MVRIFRRPVRPVLAALIVAAVVAGAVVPASAVTAGSPVVPKNLGGTTSAGYVRSDGNSYTGAGQYVVVIDGAFNPDHPSFAGKVAHEACFGLDSARGYNLADTTCSREAGIVSVDGRDHWFESAKGASRPNPECVDVSKEGVQSLCHDFHGTAAASAAAGNTVTPGGGLPTVSGVAPDAQLILIKVGRRGGWQAESVGAALHYVRTTLATDPRFKGRIAAVNMSAANETLLIPDGAACQSFPYLDDETALLKAAGIPVVVSAGNKPTTNAIGSWACQPSVVAVGSTGVADLDTFTEGDQPTVASDRVKLLAPVGSGNGPEEGVWLANNYATPTGTIMSWNKGFRGTSFASPQVAGAFAILRQQYGAGPSVDELTTILQTQGKPVTDTRFPGSHISTPRLWLTEPLAPRKASRSVWDFTGDGTADFPVLEPDGKTLALYATGPSGILNPAGAKTTVSTSWGSHAVTAPVYDYRKPGTNGFLTTTGTELFYHHYDSTTGTLDAGTKLLAGGADQITGIAFTHKWDGSTAAVIIQKTNGQIVLRPQNTDTEMLGAETELVPAATGSTLNLVGFADINDDTLPDLIVRAPTTKKPEAYLAATGTTFTTTRHLIDPTNRWSTWATYTQVSILEDWTDHQPRLSYQLPTGPLWLIALTATGTAGTTHNNGTWPTATRHLHAPQTVEVVPTPRDVSRSVWDFTGNGTADFPVLEPDGKTLTLYPTGPTGILNPARAKTTVSTSWDNHAVTAPVYDYRQPGTNGFLASTGTDLYYHHYNAATGTLDVGTKVLTGGADQIAGVAFTHKWDGSTAAAIIQKTDGQIVLRPKNATTDSLDAELELVPASTGSTLTLVGFADINDDTLPDLIVRDPVTKKPEAYLAATNSTFTPTRHLIDPTNRWGTWATYSQVSILEDWVDHQPRLTYQLPTGPLWLIALTPTGTAGTTHNNGTWPTTTRHLHAPRP